MSSSELDAAVRTHLSEQRSHSFETLTVDDTQGEYCKHCGREKKSLLKPGSSYELVPCRGLVG